MSRILFITAKNYLPWEGACYRVTHMLEALVALGYEVDLLSLAINPPPPISGVGLVTVRPLPLCSSLPDGPSVRRAIMDLLMLSRAMLLSGRNRYDFIHGVDDGGVVAAMAGRLTQTPFIFENDTSLCSAQTRSPSRRLCLWFSRFFENYALKTADAVIGSDTDIVAALARFGRHSRACVIPDIPSLPESVPTPALNLSRVRFRPAATHKLITCVGSGNRFKDEDMLFNAIPQILSAIPQARFVVVGGTEKGIQQMRKAFGKAGLLDAVTFTGRMPCTELAALLAISDVLVSTRRKGKSAPIKVLDYLYSGTPIVAADTPANRSMLSPDNALIVKPTPAALAEGIIRICRSPALGAGLSQNGRDTLRRENRTADAFRQALHRCYAYVGARA